MTSPNELEGAVAEVEEAIKDTLADHDDWLIDNPDMPDPGPDDTSASVWALRTILDALASITRERDAYALTMAEARAQVEIVHKALIKTDRDDEDPTKVAIDRASNLLDLDEGQRLLKERDAMREAGKPFFDLAKTVTTPTPGSPPWWQESQDWTVVFSFAGCSVTLGDLRRAAALVSGEVGK